MRKTIHLYSVYKNHCFLFKSCTKHEAVRHYYCSGPLNLNFILAMQHLSASSEANKACTGNVKYMDGERRSVELSRGWRRESQLVDNPSTAEAWDLQHQDTYVGWFAGW